MTDSVHPLHDPDPAHPERWRAEVPLGSIIDFFTLGKSCAYCEEAPTELRICTLPDRGVPQVSVLCASHAKMEALAAAMRGYEVR